MRAQLTSLDQVCGPAQLPRYVPEDHGVGIVHFGTGAFHRAHQAVFTDEALAHDGGDWRIVGVNLRSKDVAAQLNTQNGLYTLIERGAAETTARVIASIDHVIAADPDATLAMLCDPGVRVVTLTVTEAGYGIERESRLPDMKNQVVVADLAQPEKAVGVLGLLVASINRRRKLGLEPLAILSCDNLPDNGAYLRDGLIGFALKAYGDELADWIAANIAFPSSMVDRITPASTVDTCQEAARLTGCEDNAAIETEPFVQWVIEDNFPSGRPRWEAGGADFVADVAPYERMKLMMLNGSHSMLAYSGFLIGKTCVRDVMQDKHLSVLVGRHLRAAAALLEPLPNFDYVEYASALIDRFANPSIAHKTFQIADDGTQKLPQRIFQPAVEALDAGKDIRPFAFAAAMWMRFCTQRLDDDESYELRDPRAEELSHAVSGNLADASLLSDAIHALPDLIPPQLSLNDYWRKCISEILAMTITDGCIAAIKHEANLVCGAQDTAYDEPMPKIAPRSAV